MKDEKWEKIGWFLLIGIISAVIYILLSGKLHEIIPEGRLFGWPFDYADLILILIGLFAAVIVYLFFQNHKQKFDNKRRL